MQLKVTPSDTVLIGVITANKQIRHDTKEGTEEKRKEMI